MSLDEYDRDLMRKGQDAAIVRGVVGPYINKRIENTVQEMVNYYRSDDLSDRYLYGKVAEIAALQGLLHEIDNQQQRGFLAAEREYTNGEEADTSVDDGEEY